MMRAVIRNLFALAAFLFGALLTAAPSSAEVVPTMEGDPPPPAIDVSPFQPRPDGLAREYAVQSTAEGQAFGSIYRETFVIRLSASGPECAKQKTCVYVLFRDAQDSSPFVTFCAPGRYDTAHRHRNGMLVYQFEFVCEKSKFQIQLSPHSELVGSYIE